MEVSSAARSPLTACAADGRWAWEVEGQMVNLNTGGEPFGPVGSYIIPLKI